MTSPKSQTVKQILALGPGWTVDMGTRIAVDFAKDALDGKIETVYCLPVLLLLTVSE